MAMCILHPLLGARLGLLLLSFVGATSFGWAQESGESVAGVVKDQQVLKVDESALSGDVADAQGRGIAGASVSLKKEGAARSIDSVADTAGHFRFSNLVPGRYRLIVSAKGFQTNESELDVREGSNADLVVKLSVGTVRSTVTVQAKTDSILATNANAGSLTPTSLMDLPQSVQVANRELLDEQKTYQYADTITYMTGVQRAYTTIAGGVGNEVAMRGFNLDYNNNYLRDGFKYYGLSLSDTADTMSARTTNSKSPNDRGCDLASMFRTRSTGFTTSRATEQIRSDPGLRCLFSRG